MRFGDDTRVALRAAVALVNSAYERGDPLASSQDLSAFLAVWSYTGRREVTRRELDAVRGLRPALRVLLLARRDEAADIVNMIFAEAQAVPQLRRHDGQDWHLHTIDDDRSLSERVLVETATAMADLIRANEMSRLNDCAAEGCDRVVLDLSRNRSRRYCSTSCSNREAVAAYRARQKA